MITSKFIASLIVVLAIVLMWTHFCRQTGSSLEQARMNQANMMFPGCCWRIYSGHLQMGKHLLFQSVIFISYIVVVSGCFYKLLTHNRSKYKVINGHDSRHIFQWQGLTVMSLDDYFRDRLNNNLGMRELMKYEWARYESFKLYPLTAPLSPSKLARAGFYYTGENQTVKCFCCGEQFCANDYEELNEAHQRNSRNCSFARGEASANIPIKHSDRSDNVNFGSRDNQNMTQCKHPNYVTKESRRKTFRTWPHENIRQTQEMVEAGLFYTGTRDIVLCYHCGMGFKDWSDDDDHRVEHARLSPNCQLMRQQSPVFRHSGADLDMPINHTGGAYDREQQHMTQCRYPEYVTEESRRLSFINWRHGNIRQTQAMAAAGLFYAGIADCVRCFYCGVGLRNWLDDDDPWIEHARFSPECQHVRQHIPDRPSLNELNTDHRQEASSSDQISSDMRSKSVQILKHMGYTEDRIIYAFNNLRRSGRQEISINDLLDNIKATEPNIYNRDSPSYRMLCTRMNAANNSGDQNESQIVSGQQNERPTDTDTLRHRLTCKICLDEEICIVFLPCGHLVACEECALNLQTCAVCRADIRESVRTYF